MVKASPVNGHDDHEVRLAGAWSVRGDGAPSIVERQDEAFLPAFLTELAGRNPAGIVPAQRPRNGDDGRLRLFQPIHRAFNLVLLEAHCDTFGQPRLDPRKIESAGHVVRRVRIQSDGTTRHEAWCASQHQVAGWVTLPPAANPEHDRDPEPTRRPQPRLTADPAFDRAHFGSTDLTAEESTALFVAPPATAAATTRTLLYGIIPLASASRAGAMPKGAAPADADWTAHLSLFLRPSANPVPLWPAGSDAQRAALLDRADVKNNPVTLPDSSIHPAATRFVLLVRQLAQEFSLLRPVNPGTGQRLLTTLNRLRVTLVDGSTRPAGDYLAAAARVYFDQPKPDLALPRPHTWPAVSAAVATELQAVLQQTTSETELSVFRSESGGGRFDDPTARYVIRAFIRVKRPGGCPPKLVWSPYSEEFSIAPWFESGPAGPVPIVLPDLTPDFLKKARPNVAFTVPAKLANTLNQDPKKFLEGNAGAGSSFNLDWICGFNLPIITICAFFVLNIFLSLLNLVFFWLPYVKICVPFPRKK
jgi:hypothetical protein